MEARGAGDAVPIGEGEGVVAMEGGCFDEVFGVAAALEEGKSAARAKFDIVQGGGHAILSLYFRY